MRPPDNLAALKSTPFALATVGILVVPAMWAFLLPIGVVLTMSPFTGILFLLFGLHMTYRSRFSPEEALWSFVIGLIFFGSLLTASTTSLVWQMQRPDLVGMALGLTTVTGGGALLLGFLGERRRLQPTQDGIPIALMPLLDLKKGQLRSLPAKNGPPVIGRIAFLAALVMNVPLVLQINGFNGNNVLWLAMPILFATVTYVLATGFGPALARILSLRRVERHIGKQLTTCRLDELTQMRRQLWLARWLCRREDRGPGHP